MQANGQYLQGIFTDESGFVMGQFSDVYRRSPVQGRWVISHNVNTRDSDAGLTYVQVVSHRTCAHDAYIKQMLEVGEDKIVLPCISDIQPNLHSSPPPPI